MGKIVNLRRARKQRTRVAATKDSAAKRAKSGRARAEREATERAWGLDEKRHSLLGDPAISIERRAEFAVTPAFATCAADLKCLAGAAIAVLRIKSLFSLIPGFKLTERLFKIESEPDVNTAC